MDIKIIAIGDQHFQINNIPDVELFIEKITKLVKEKKPDFAVLLGDLLHTHERLHTIPLNKAYNFIDNIRKECKTYILVGNHDMCNNQQFLSDNHWLNALKEWDNLVVVDKLIIEKIKSQHFVFCPYVAPGRFEEALNTIGDEWKNATCIFAHQEFYGCKMGAITSIEGDKWSLDYPNVISGHIHKNQTPQENIYYPGSSLQIAFGESENNIIPYIVFDEEGSYELEEIDLVLRKKKIIYKTVDEIDDYNIPNTEDELKVSLSGDYNEFKTFKKTKKYKELINKGVKVIFKPKRIENEIKNENIKKIINKNTDDLTNFKKIITDIVEEHNDPYLNEIFEKIINNK
jgi:DNA repair exonuclease SbcCD nuclease subunit